LREGRIVEEEKWEKEAIEEEEDCLPFDRIKFTCEVITSKCFKEIYEKDIVLIDIEIIETIDTTNKKEKKMNRDIVKVCVDWCTN
jgi:hypothetical protein